MKQPFSLSRVPTQSMGTRSRSFSLVQVPTQSVGTRTLITILILLAVPIGASAGGSAGFDLDAWRSLPVQEGGRYMPFDTQARETARTLGDPSGFADPETGRKLDAFDFILTLWLTGREETSMRRPGDEHFHIDRPDAWDAAPLLGVGSSALGQALGLPAGEKFISPLGLAKAKFRDPESGAERTFLQEVRLLDAGHPARPPTDLEQKVLRLADAFGVYRKLRGGRWVHFVPLPGKAEHQWMTGGALLEIELSDADDPSGLLRKAQTAYRRVLAAFRTGTAEEFRQTSTELFKTLEELGRQVKDYPAPGVIALEVAYNRWAPFRWAWIFCGGAFLLGLAGFTKKRDAALFFRYPAMAALGVALAAMLAGFAARGVILGWVPVTTMYETVLLLGLGSALVGFCFGLFSRWHVFSAATAVAVLALILADSCPTVLNPAIQPPLPVLRSNFWLVVHVVIIMSGYVALTLALALSDIALGFHLFRRAKKGISPIFRNGPETGAMPAWSPQKLDLSPFPSALGRVIYRTLQVGVWLLALGTILGAMWGDYAWARFWGWDPKEVGALVTLLVYLALLHARRAGWVGELGLAAWSVRCFAAIIFTWYVVNFVLGTGMHSYGFGGGGAIYVLGAVLLQELYVEAAVLRGLFDRPQKSKPLAV
jgi:cytochrome c-type biogenesis protein CcsB